MTQLLTYPDIDPQQWQALVDRSPYATWFQTKEAYEFYASLPEEMTPFAVAIQRTNKLVAVCVGYITQAKNKLVQCLTRRAIIIGGPVIDEDATTEEITALLNAVKKRQRSDLQPAGRSYNTIIFFRRESRPMCFFAPEEERILFSPATVEMAGIGIVANRESFDRLTPARLRDIIREVADEIV